MPRDLLNQGIHVADLNVAAGAVPEADPTLSTHGYPTAQRSASGAYFDLPVVLVVVDLVGGVTPTVDLNLWGYAQPPAVGAVLSSDWQLIDTVTVSDTVGPNPTFAIIPCAGFLRFDVKVNAIGGAPTSVRIRLIGTTHYTSDLMIAAGAVAGVANKVDIIEVAGTAVAATTLAGTLPTEDDIRKIAGTAIAATSVAGTLPVETDHRQVAGSAIAATSVAGTFPTEPDHRKVAGNTIATTGINGTFPGEGTQATGTVLDAAYPYKIGAEIVQIPANKTDGHFWNLILDLQRFLRVVNKSFDSLSFADKVSNLNTSATDFDYFLIAQETNITQPAVQYYPSASGWALGSRKNLGILLKLEDITSVALQVTNDPTLAATSWLDITANVTDPATGTFTHAATHWTEPGSGTPIAMAMALDKCEFTYARLAVVGSAAANTFEAYGHAGAL